MNCSVLRSVWETCRFTSCLLLSGILLAENFSWSLVLGCCGRIKRINSLRAHIVELGRTKTFLVLWMNNFTVTVTHVSVIHWCRMRLSTVSWSSCTRLPSVPCWTFCWNTFTKTKQYARFSAVLLTANHWASCFH